MQLTEEQIAQVENIYLALGEEDEFDLEAAVADLQTSEQLHLFVYNWNWDSGVEPLFSVIRHPQCDKGTALYVFWLTDPVYLFDQYGEGDQPRDWEQEYYNLVVEIRDRFRAGNYALENISCDPKQVAVGLFKFDALKQEIPEGMRQPTKGQDIDSLMEHFGLS